MNADKRGLKTKTISALTGVPPRVEILFFALLFALLLAARMCHAGILWEGDTLPLAAAGQMLHGKVLYRDIWYDKPPLVPAFHLLSGGAAGWSLRFAGALYALLCCLIGYGFARDLWSRREGLWAAALLAIYLTFYIPSAVIPVASDLLLLAPHAAAVWMAYKRRPFWSGALAGVAFWISPKAVFVAAACVLWHPAGAPLMAAGFAAVSGVAAGWLWAGGALGAYWREVWEWGRLYAGGTFVAEPWKNGLARTLNWMGFHAAAAAAAAWFLVGIVRAGDRRAVWRWGGWLALALIGVAAGLRFFPRYYFLALPVVALMAARGFATLGRARLAVGLLLMVPVVRFGPSYVAAANPRWRDTAMDRDSRAAAAIIRQTARPGDTLFVWGYRPELFAYTGLLAGSMYLDSQPLTGVPADRHLTQSTPVETTEARRRRAELVALRPPDIVADGLSAYNPALAMTRYPELAAWMEHYALAGRTGETAIYRRIR
jgi:hypothetical protein